MSKEFDCVEMKHKAAEKVKEKIVGLSIKEELTFWKKPNRIFEKTPARIFKEKGPHYKLTSD